MVTSLILDRIAAWESAGLIDAAMAGRLRAAEQAEQAASLTGPAAAAPAERSTRIDDAPAGQDRQSSFILEFFAYLGGLFVLIAWYTWSLTTIAPDPWPMGTRHLAWGIAGLAPAIMLGSAGWLMTRSADARLRRAAAVSLSIAVPNAGVAVMALLQAASSQPDRGSVPLFAGAAAAFGLAVVARVRQPGALVQGVLIVSWAVMADAISRLAEQSLWPVNSEWGSVLRDAAAEPGWQLARLVWWLLVAAAPAVVLLRRPDRRPGGEARAAVARAGIGAIAVVGSASAVLATYPWNTRRGLEPVFEPWMTAGILLGIAAVFVAAARAAGSRVHLASAGCATLTALTYLNARYVVGAVGTAAALLLEGGILIGLAAFGWGAGRLVARRTATL
jgi:hypothetical protein